jgi:pimeloyl-[acyl-carrier protein] methyl ester esterase
MVHRVGVRLVNKVLASVFLSLWMTSLSLGQDSDPNRVFEGSELVVRERFSDEVMGRGPDLVFITGLAASRLVWKSTAERLRTRYRLHLIQVAGFAGEPSRANASGDVLIPTAEALDEYLRERKLTPATVIGHVTGGSAILYLAQRRPEDLHKAFIVDALPFIGAVQNPPATSETLHSQATRAHDRILATGKITAAQIEPEMAAMSKNESTRRLVAEWRARSDHTVVARAYREHLTSDLRRDLPQMKTPILLLHPDMTPLGVPPGAMEKSFREAYAPARNVRTQVVPDSLHFVMLDQPKAFAAALDAFLDD